MKLSRIWFTEAAMGSLENSDEDDLFDWTVDGDMLSGHDELGVWYEEHLGGGRYIRRFVPWTSIAWVEFDTNPPVA